LWFCSYGSPISLKFGESNYLRLQFRHAGAGATRIDGDLTAVTAQQACISSAPAIIDFPDGFQQLVWRLDRDALVRKFSALTDRPASRAIEFASVLTLDSAAGEGLMSILRCMLGIIDRNASLSSQLVLREMEQALIVSLLSSGDHSHREMVEGVPPQLLPRQVRRVEEYIAANCNGPLDIEQLALVAGASVRSIYRAFRRHRGYSPMEFAKQRRLLGARSMLMDSGAQLTITQVALACGFNDVSHFSREFSRAFGEAPSALLKRHAREGATSR
jgi:transcriptional regulator GlxA family with amidase domain